MKDIELLAESIAKDAAIACAARIAVRITSGDPDTPERVEAVRQISQKGDEHINRALKCLVANYSDLKMFMTMPPINPS